MKRWNVVITRTDNGWIVRGPSPTTDTDIEVVFRDKEGRELFSARDMLWQVLEFFGVYYSKHNKSNLVVRVVRNKNHEG